jgi:hypothetical protein
MSDSQKNQSLKFKLILNLMYIYHIMPDKKIPSSEESQETRNKQEFVEGQSKDVNVEGYAEITSLAQAFKNLGFPATKSEIVNFYQSGEPNSEVLARLRDIEDKQYSNVSEIARATHLVS